MGDSIAEQPDGNSVSEASTAPTHESTSRAIKPEETAEYWRSKYHGREGYINQITRELNNLREEYRAFTVRHEEETSALKSQIGERERLEQERSLLQRKVDAYEQREALLATLTAKEEFAPLIPAFAKGLLNVDGLEGEALDARLNDYLTFTTGIAQRKLEETLAGSTPPPPPGNTQPAGETSQQLWQNLMQRRDFGTPEYRKAEEAYYAALDAEEAAARGKP